MDATLEPETVRAQVGLLSHAQLRLRGSRRASRTWRSSHACSASRRPPPSEALERLGLSPKRRPTGAAPTRPACGAASPWRDSSSSNPRWRSSTSRSSSWIPTGRRGARGSHPGAARRRHHDRSRHPPHRTGACSSARTDCIWNRDDRSPHEAPWPAGLDVGPLPQGPAARVALTRAGERAALLLPRDLAPLLVRPRARHRAAPPQRRRLSVARAPSSPACSPWASRSGWSARTPPSRACGSSRSTARAIFLAKAVANAVLLAGLGSAAGPGAGGAARRADRPSAGASSSR